MEKIKLFKVGVYEEQGGYYFIEADNKEEAEKKAEEMLYDSVEMHKITTGSREVLSVDEIIEE